MNETKTDEYKPEESKIPKKYKNIMDKVRNTSSLGDLSDIFSKLNMNSPNKKEIINASTDFISSI